MDLPPEPSGLPMVLYHHKDIFTFGSSRARKPVAHPSSRVAWSLWVPTSPSVSLPRRNPSIGIRYLRSVLLLFLRFHLTPRFAYIFLFQTLLLQFLSFKLTDTPEAVIALTTGQVAEATPRLGGTWGGFQSLSSPGSASASSDLRPAPVHVHLTPEPAGEQARGVQAWLPAGGREVVAKSFSTQPGSQSPLRTQVQPWARRRHPWS